MTRGQDPRTPGDGFEIVWSPAAQARLRQIRAHIAQDKPEAAERLAMRIVAVAEALRYYPLLGRTGAEPGLRELVIGGTPYIIFYRVREKRVVIVTIWHGAQQRPISKSRKTKLQ